MCWPFQTLKYKYFFQIKYTEAILSNSTRKLLWFEISKMLMAVLKLNLLRYLLYFWAHCRSLCVRWHAQRGGQIGNIIPPFVLWTAGGIMFSKCSSISASVCACPGLCFLRRWLRVPVFMCYQFYDTIRDAILACAPKLTSQLNLPHGTINYVGKKRKKTKK